MSDPSQSLYADHNGRAQDHIREAAQLLGEMVNKFTGKNQWGTQRFQMTVSALALLNHAWALTRASINEGEGFACSVQPIQGTVSDIMSREFLEAVEKIVNPESANMLGKIARRSKSRKSKAA